MPTSGPFGSVVGLGVNTDSLNGKKPAFIADPIGNLLTPGQTKYDPVSQQLANLSSSEWSQAASFLYPAQNQLINYAEDPNYINNQRTKAIGDVDTAFGNQQQDQQRQFGLQGINPTADQSDAINKQTALSKAKAEAGAGNAAAAQAQNNQLGALRGF